MAPRLVSLLVILTSLSACDREDEITISPSCAEAAEREDLAFLQEEVFTKACAFSGCHSGGPGEPPPTLAAGTTLINTVGVQSTLIDEVPLITPGDPTMSYLMLIMDNSRPDLIIPSVGLMPFSRTTLCQEKLDSVSRWISDMNFACSDGVDNDQDGLIDFDGGDPDCDSAIDDDESSAI